MKLPKLTLTLLLAVAVLATGCSTFQSRAKEKAGVFSALDAPTRARLKQGHLQLGDTMDMAYIALGEPDDTHDQLSADGRAVVWIYNHYWQEYSGERVAGYSPVSAPDPKTGVPTVFYEPVEQSVYQDHVEEALRVTFKNDKVTMIEQPKK